MPRSSPRAWPSSCRRLDQARQADRSPVGRLRRDLALVVRPRGWWASPRRATVAGVLVLIALILAALVIVSIGSRRHLPPPFGVADNGRIAFVQQGHVYQHLRPTGRRRSSADIWARTRDRAQVLA